MPLSFDNSISVDVIRADQQNAIVRRQAFFFENTRTPRFFSLESDISTISTEDSQSLSTNKSLETDKSSDQFRFGSKIVPRSKKYSLQYVSNTDIQELIRKFDAIVDKVEKRQNNAAARSPTMPHHPHWDLIASAVREKMKNTSYKNIIFGDVSQFKKEAGTFEDQIARKQICTSGKRLAPRREWRTLYAVLKDNTLSFYKDIVYRRNDATYHDEAPLIIDGATTVIETSSKTRKYLIRLKLHDGSEYVLQCQTISQWARWLAELNITIKRHTPHTTITTPFESSISESSIKSNVSSIPSTPSYTKHIVLNVTTVESRRSSSVDEGIGSPATVPNNLGSLVTGVVETPHPRVLLAGIVSIDNSIDESIVEHQGTIRSDINNNEFTLDFSNQTSSDSLV